MDNLTEPLDPIEPGVAQPTPAEGQAVLTQPADGVGTAVPAVPAGPGGGPPPGSGPPTGQGPPPGYVWGGWPGGPTPPPAPSGSGFSRFVRSATVAWIVAGILALTVMGLSIALASSNSNPAVGRVPFGRYGSGPGRPFGGPGAFRGNGGGGGYFGGNSGRSGVVGTVVSVGSKSFTVTDASGQTVTVDEQSSTTYSRGGAIASAGAVVAGDRVAVRGSRTGNTLTATTVIVLPSGGFGPGG